MTRYDAWKLSSPYEHDDAAIAAFYEVEEDEVTERMRDDFESDVKAEAADRRNDRCREW